MLASTPAASTISSSSFDALVLAHLRRARIKARLIQNRIDYAGVALSHGWVTAEDALGIIDEVGLLPFVLGSS